MPSYWHGEGVGIVTIFILFPCILLIPSFLIATIGEAVPHQTVVSFLSQVTALFSYLTSSFYLRLIPLPPILLHWLVFPIFIAFHSILSFPFLAIISLIHVHWS